jgi:hypothetical protein
MDCGHALDPAKWPAKIRVKRVNLRVKRDLRLQARIGASRMDKY